MILMGTSRPLMGNFWDINGDISRTLMGIFEDICLEISMTLMGNFDDINGEFRGHKWYNSRTFLGHF